MSGVDLPLSDLQLAYLVGRESPLLGGTACWLCWEVAQPTWDVARLEAAWNTLVTRHASLRTIFPPGGGQRVLHSVPPYAIERLDLRGESPAITESRLGTLREHLFHTHTDAACWPLFRLAVAETGHGMRLFAGFDMLIADVAGIFRLLRELAHLHAVPAMMLTPLGGSYQDAVHAWQQRKHASRQQASAAYWMPRLDDFPAAPALPLADTAPAASRFRRHEHRLPRDRWQAFQQQAAARGLRRVPAIVAAFSEVLARWAAQKRFTLNVTAGKHPAGSLPEGVVGDFSTNVLLAVDCTAQAGAAPFSQRVRAVGEQLASDLAHADMSGVAVASALSRRRGEQVLMPVVFSSLLHAHAELALLGRFVTGITRTPQVTLDCQIMDDDGGLYLSWDVLEGHYQPGLCEAMFEAWTTLIDQLAEVESAWDARAPAALPAVQRTMRAAVNDTAEAWPPATLHAAVLEQARAAPERMAVAAAGASLSYGELARRAGGVAQALRNAGARPGELVAIVLEKGARQVVAALAVQMSGAAYLPIDLATPPERVAELMRLGACRYAIADDGVATGAGVLRIHDLIAADTQALQPVPDAGPATPDDLAYVIFTSGSTGTPKGVTIRHRAAANTVRDINSRYGVGRDDRVLGLSSLNFDLSVWDIFGTLAAGATLVLPLSESLRDPDYLRVLVRTQGVTIWNSVPSHLQMLAEDCRGMDSLASLRLAMLSGDWIPVGLPARMAVPIVSLGGATEASIWSIAYPVVAVPPGWPSIPYGKPLANQRWHVLDECMQDCPDGIAGELYIAGDGLAEGYWDDEVRTQASFVSHPDSGERLYRTGDWGRFHADGNIEFLGRSDGQVKISGHRVELGEVEAALLRCDGVVSAAAVTFTDAHSQKRLAAYYCGAGLNGAAPGAVQVRARLQQMVPAYMVPQRLEALDALPLTANGKVDRKTLSGRAAAPSEASLHGNQSAPPAATALQRLFNTPGVLTDEAARRALAAKGGLRHDLDQTRQIALPASTAPGLLPRWASVRAFSGTVTLNQFDALLQGLRAVDSATGLRRAYPSAGDSASVQTYVQIASGGISAVPGGLYYYHPLRHALLPVRGTLTGFDAAIHVPANQAMAEQAAFTLFFFTDLDALRPLYGDMAEPFAWMEAGHMGQILRQSAGELGLGLCLVGAYDTAPVAAAFGLGAQHLALAAMVGGIPAAAAQQPTVPVPSMPVSPATDGTAEAIAAIWRDVLDLPDVGLNARFFELGGTSFSMLEVQRALSQRLHCQISITNLFRYTTISQLAAHLAGTTPQIAPLSLPHAPADETLAGKRDMRRALRAALTENRTP